MRPVRYNVAASLNGYIGAPDGDYEWIPKDPTVDVAGIFAQVDTVLLGRHSYELVRQGRAPPWARRRAAISESACRRASGPGRSYDRSRPARRRSADEHAMGPADPAGAHAYSSLPHRHGHAGLQRSGGGLGTLGSSTQLPPGHLPGDRRCRDSELREAGDSVREEAQLGTTLSPSAVYLFDVPGGCHVQMVAGPDTLLR
jgi:hypothetical protein